MRFLYVLLIAISFLPGCTPMKPGGTTIPKALAGIQSDVALSGAMAVTGSPQWTETETEAFSKSVLASQCQQKRADPVVVSMIGNMSMTLSGSYDTSGQFTVGSMTSVPVVGISGSTSRTIGQSVEFPITFVSLSALPDAVLLKRLTAVKGTFNEKAESSSVELDGLIKSYWAEHDDLATRVSALISTWNPSVCNGTAPAVLFGKHE